MRLTEFYNDAIQSGATVGTPDSLAPRSKDAAWRDGALVAVGTGEALRSDFVVVRGGIDLQGERVATGTRAPLAVWDVGGGPVRLARPPRSPGCAGGRLDPG